MTQLGPEKGVIHLATAAVLNAVWDLWARAEGKVGPPDELNSISSQTSMTPHDSRLRCHPFALAAVEAAGRHGES